LLIIQVNKSIDNVIIPVFNQVNTKHHLTYNKLSVERVSYLVKFIFNQIGMRFFGMRFLWGKRLIFNTILRFIIQWRG